MKGIAVVLFLIATLGAAWRISKQKSPSTLATSTWKLTRLNSATPSTTDPSQQKSALKTKLFEDMMESMKNKEKVRLTSIKAIQAAIKQKEVDERIELT
jgi:hypothetical protein